MKLATAYFTICARNYLAFAATLAESLRAKEPDASFFVFLADDTEGTEAFPETIIPMSALDLPEIGSMQFRYTLLEFATAIKPACLLHLLQSRNFTHAMYLDPDIQVFAPFDAVREAFAAGASCVLTPHLLQPLQDTASPSDLDILGSGTFNLGFCAFDASIESLSYLSWWQDRLIDQGYNALEQGQFVDQKWMDFAPSFLSRLHILRDPGYNVAYWNLAHRPVRQAGNGTWIAGETKLIFFHFSGVVPGNSAVISKHQDRFTAENAGAASRLVAEYLARVSENGQNHWSGIPYAYGKFLDGSPIAPVMRRGPDAGAQSFAQSDTSWWHAPSERADQAPGVIITRFMLALHESRPDLRAVFPLSSGQGRAAFHAWFLTHGYTESGGGEAALEGALGRSLRAGAAPPPKVPAWLSRFLPAALRTRLKSAFVRMFR